MNYFNRISIILTLCLLIFLPMTADTLDINISLAGTQEVPSNGSAGTGSELGSGLIGCYYDDTNDTLHIRIQFSGLGSNVTAAHIHGPATIGVNAGVVQALTDFPTGVTSGTYTRAFFLNATNEGYLKAENLYINIHTTGFTGGEIRGQLLNGGILPVELTAFNAIVKGRSVELAWQTATETNNHGFEIERKLIPAMAGRHGSGIDPSNMNPEPSTSQWLRVGFVEGNGTSNISHSYGFVDQLLPVGKYSYRLKQIDRDGKFAYGQLVEAEVFSSVKGFSLKQNYPNPFNPRTFIIFDVTESEYVNVSVYNALGQIVETIFSGIAQPYTHYRTEFNGTGRASGIYFCVLLSSRHSEIRKMILSK